MKDERQTLGENVVPINYNLAFEPNLKTFRYRCIERISARIKKSTKSIALNLIGLDIKSATITNSGKTQRARKMVDKTLERMILTFDRPVRGNVEISIDFEGRNGDKYNGFYRSKYFVGNKKHYILTTQFEAADARRAFPCFDEPAFKATFELSFLIDNGLTVVSNMPVRSTIKRANKKLVTFMRTPKMSTYLVYFGIGRFERLRGRYGKVELNVVTVPGKIRLAGTALEFGKIFLRYYESYFGIRYPLPKMDFIAIPDYAIAGMENWGAITFSEIALLTDKKATSVIARQRIAEVVAHELAHQWFGDLVTMRWWDNLWLNESFATFMSYKAVKSAFPKWQMDVQAILGRTGTALGADQLRSTQPVEVKVNSPGDMSEAFDPAITYSKGAAVLAMLEDYVGEGTFREGLRHYIRKYSYSNTTEHNLWDSIGKAIRKNRDGSRFDSIASYWINIPGYPMVEVKHTSGRLRLIQQRFFLLDKKDASTWPVPVRYSKGSGGRKLEGLVFLDRKSMDVKEDSLEYIKLNYGQKGFYRVKYAEDMLDRLGQLIKSRRISALDGWGIENDLYAIARSTKIKVDKYLDFVDRYCFDSEFPLNSSVSGHLNALYLLLHDNKKVLRRVRDVNIRYHRNILNGLGWKRRKGDSNTTILLRRSAIASLGELDDKDVVRRSEKLFEDYIKKKSSIDPDIRSAVYNINARTGGTAAFNRFMKLYKKEQIPEEQLRFLRAIGSVKDPDLIEKALRFALSKDVRLQYVDLIPALVSTEDYGRRIIWKWIKSNWKRLMSMYEPGPGGLDDFIDILATQYDPAVRKDMGLFFKKKANYRDDIKRSVAKTLEYMDINIRFREFNGG